MSQVNFDNTVLVCLNIQEYILAFVFRSIVAGILLSIHLMVHVNHELQIGRCHHRELAVSREVGNNILCSLSNNHITVAKYDGMFIKA